MAVFFVCLPAGWETVRIAGVLFLALAVAFAVRLVHRKLHGASWDQAKQAEDGRAAPASIASGALGGPGGRCAPPKEAQVAIHTSRV
jgi:hypothetical protein